MLRLFNQPDFELAHRRIVLQPLNETHIDALFEAANDPLIWEFMAQKIQTVDDMKEYVEKALVQKMSGREFPFIVVDSLTNQIVGSTRYVDISLEHRTIEIGRTFLHPSVWRTSVNSECKYVLMRYAFEEMQVNRLQLKTDERNVRSQRAIERLGAVREGLLRHHWVLQDGHRRNTVIYSILTEEWPDVKARLEMFLGGEERIIS
ncbi:MAG: GNAT family N-acetyltransferase [Bacilli bacterium]